MRLPSKDGKSYQLPLFFLLCLVIAWSIWIPQAINKLRAPQEPFASSSPINLIAVWAPALSALFLSQLKGGKAGLQALFGPIRRWRVGIGWYLFSMLYPAAIWFLARGIDALLGRSLSFTAPILTYFPPEQSYMVAVALIFAFPNTLGEELGWRGFALPRLQSKSTALIASLMLGSFWAVWHLPMWIANGIMGMDLLRSGLSITSAAIIFTWVYNNTGGSLLLAWLFHTTMTITQYFLPFPLTLTDDLVRWGAAIFIVIMAGSTHMSRRNERIRRPTGSLMR
jgi:membrane protease YdiL (CAAX protease family)